MANAQRKRVWRSHMVTDCTRKAVAHPSQLYRVGPVFCKLIGRIEAERVASMGEALAVFEQRVGYHFCDRALLQRALLHSSSPEATGHANERLEFLGDAVLGLAIAQTLCEQRPYWSEGQLTRARSTLVRGASLAVMAKALALGDYLVVGPSMLGRPLPEAVLADACEALIGAVFLDGGWRAAKRFVARWCTPLVADLDEAPGNDAKSCVQEWCQQRGLPLPGYTVTDLTGPDHAPAFEVAVSLDSGLCAKGEGATKKQAEQRAASLLLEQLGGELPPASFIAGGEGQQPPTQPPQAEEIE